MAIEIKVKELKSALTFLKFTIPVRPTLPILSNIKVEVRDDYLRLTSTNLTTFSSIEILCENVYHDCLDFLIDFKAVETILKGKKDTCLDLLLEDEQVRIEFPSGFKQNIAIDGVNGFPETPTPDLKVKDCWKISGLDKRIGEIIPFASTEETKQELTGVNFNAYSDKLELIATNGHILTALYPTVYYSGESMNTTVYAKEIKGLFTFDEFVEIYQNDSEPLVKFEGKDRKIITRKIESRYPQAQDLIPKKANSIISVDTNELIAHLEYLNKVYKDKITSRYKDGIIELSFGGVAMGVTLCINDGEFSQSVTYTLQSGDSNIENVAFQIPYLIKCLTPFKKEKAYFHILSPKEPVVISDSFLITEGIITLICPVQLVK